MNRNLTFLIKLYFPEMKFQNKIYGFNVPTYIILPFTSYNLSWEIYFFLRKSNFFSYIECLNTPCLSFCYSPVSFQAKNVEK